MRHLRDKDKADTNPVDPFSIDFDADARRRMENAVTNLTASRSGYPISDFEHARLGGKVEGLKLALSYLDDAARLKGGTPASV